MKLRTNVIILNHLIDSLLELGASHSLLELYGFYNYLDQDELPISMMQTFWDYAYELTGDQTIGTRVAERAQPALLKELGLSMLTSQNLKEGLDGFVKYSSIFSTGLVFSLVDLNGKGTLQSRIALRMKPTDPSCRYSKYAVDFALHLIKRFSELTAPNTGLLIEVCNRVGEQTSSSEVNGPAYVGEVVYLSHEIEKPLLLKDERLSAYYEEQLITKLKTSANAFTKEVINYLTFHSDWSKKNACSLASAFNMTLRTFHRRLAQEGTHFSKLLNEYRYKLAMDALTNKRMTVTQTAYLLGYKDVASFSKAFKRWDGRTPSAYGGALV